MKRTTVRLPEDLMLQCKRQAAETGRTFTALLADALRAELSRRRAAKPPAPVRLRTVKGRGLLPGVDLDDSAGLLDLMGEGTPERRDARAAARR